MAGAVNWLRFGLGAEPAAAPARPEPEPSDHPDGVSALEQDELFADEQREKPWWRANFFVSTPVQFGTWDGVFTSVVVNIFGVIVLLRSGWVVAQAGLPLTVLIILASVFVVLTSVLSAIGIFERCPLASGGVYALISQVLGSHAGTAFGLVYCFGQAVGCALCAAAFGESMTDLLHTDSGWVPWVERALGVALVAVLTAINVAGVKWVVKVQFLLLALLALAVLDFLFGSLIGVGVGSDGVVGWSGANLANNTAPAYRDGHTWFSVFGVFFPSLTGVMAGINMSGDLREPRRDIPRGTLAALGVSTVLYILFALVLAATCSRHALLTDYIIAERVAATGVLLMIGLYISSSSSCLSTLYGTPRVLQSIANENILRFLKPLGKVRGEAQVPVPALATTAMATLVFILIGQINRLAPIVTLPYLLMYAAIDYAYFALAHAYDIQQSQAKRHRVQPADSPTFVVTQKEGATTYGAVDRVSKQTQSTMQASWESSCTTMTGSLPSSPEDDSSSHSVRQVATDKGGEPQPESGVPVLMKEREGLRRQPSSWYSPLCNRWVSLVGMLLKLAMMVLVNWLYCLLTVLATALLWFWAHRSSPGCPAGYAAEFRLGGWLLGLLQRATGRRWASASGYEQMVVTPAAPSVSVQQEQVTEHNADFEGRSKYHQVVQDSKPLLADD